MAMNFLEFEQPIAELEAKIEELKFLGQDSSVNITEEIKRLQSKSRALRSSRINVTRFGRRRISSTSPATVVALPADQLRTPSTGAAGFGPPTSARRALTRNFKSGS